MNKKELEYKFKELYRAIAIMGLLIVSMLGGLGAKIDASESSWNITAWVALVGVVILFIKDIYEFIKHKKEIKEAEKLESSN